MAVGACEDQGRPLQRVRRAILRVHVGPELDQHLDHVEMTVHRSLHQCARPFEVAAGNVAAVHRQLANLLRVAVRRRLPYHRHAIVPRLQFFRRQVLLLSGVEFLRLPRPCRCRRGGSRRRWDVTRTPPGSSFVLHARRASEGSSSRAQPKDFWSPQTRTSNSRTTRKSAAKLRNAKLHIAPKGC